MKKIFMAVMALFLLVACGGTVTQNAQDAEEKVVVEKKDVYMLGADIYNEAAEKLKNVKTEDELELIESGIQESLDALENSKEMAEYIACVNSGDSVSLQGYDISRQMLEDAAAAYSAALLEAYVQCGR